MTRRTGNRRGLELADFIGRHPLRPIILDLVDELDVATGGQGASPVEIVRHLEGTLVANKPVTLGVIAYHVRELARLGGLELVRRTQVRGALEHFYSLTPAGEAARAGDPLEVAVAALERILEEDHGATVATRHAEEALERLGRLSSVAA